MVDVSSVFIYILVVIFQNSKPIFLTFLKNNVHHSITMSEIFHKSCFTKRSAGYKYRTLGTNTGDKEGRKRIADKEESTVERKIREIRSEVSSRADVHVEQAHSTRQIIGDKFLKVESKISAMLELKEVMAGLQKDLTHAEDTLVVLAARVERLQEITGCDDYSLRSRKSSFRKPHIFRDVQA